MFVIPEKTPEEIAKEDTLIIIKVALDITQNLENMYEVIFKLVWAGTKEEIQARFDLLGPQAFLIFQGAQIIINAILIGKPEYTPPPAPYQFSFTPQKVVVGDAI